MASILDVFTSQTFGIPTILFLFILALIIFIIYKAIMFNIWTKYEIISSQWKAKSGEYDYISSKYSAKAAKARYETQLQERENVVRQFSVMASQIEWYKGGYEMQQEQIKLLKERLKQMTEAKSKNDLQNHYNTASEYYGRGEYDRAIAEYKSVLKIDPESALPHQYMGMAYYRKGQLEKAIEEYATAKSIDPNDLNLIYNLGLALEKKGMIERAKEEYYEVLKMNPNHTEAKSRLQILEKNN